MAKIRLNGEVFNWAAGKKPKMSEALAIEETYGRGYVQWQQDLAGGSLRAMCTLAWFIWRQNGRDVPIDDIMSDDFDFDFTDFLESVIEASVAGREEDGNGEAEAVPTIPGASPGPAGSPTTSSGTSASSRSTSISGRGKSRSSKSGNSKS